MKRMTRKTRVFVGALLVLALLIGLFAASPQAKAALAAWSPGSAKSLDANEADQFTTSSRPNASVTVGYAAGGMWLDPNEADAFIMATCPSGQLLLGGGWSSSSSDMYVWRSMQSGNSWMIGATNTNSSTRQYVSVWASCASGFGSASTRSISTTVTVNSQDEGCATLECSSPRPIASGGGFSSSSYSPSDLSLTTTQPTNVGDNQWISCFYNPTSSNKTFTAYAVCTNLLGIANYRAKSGSGDSIPGGGNTGYDYAYCDNAGEKAISGGFVTGLSDHRFEPDNRQTVRLFYNFAKGAWSQWKVSAYYAGSGPAQLQLASWAKCFKP